MTDRPSQQPGQQHAQLQRIFTDACGLRDGERTAYLDEACRDEPELRAEVSGNWKRGIERDQIFGVPSFVYADRLYWGQDRMHFLRSAVQRKSAARA